MEAHSSPTRGVGESLGLYKSFTLRSHYFHAIRDAHAAKVEPGREAESGRFIQGSRGVAEGSSIESGNL